MSYQLPELPYALDALEPHISRETLEYHYGKHHQAYVNNLNKLIAGTRYEQLALEQIIRESSSGLFNNAAQVWNHTFYWNSMSPNGGGEPSGKLAESIQKTFGSFEEFKDAFSKSAVTNFGSGWTWLTETPDGGLEILNTGNANTPIANGTKTLLTIDVWEHAYYIDYRNARPKYVEVFWNLVNWEFANKNLS
ncbi:MAG: superoxide dismutase [Fidelibacterota bacterium]